MSKRPLKMKNKLIIFLLLNMTQVFSATCGDVDVNGDINIADALMIAQVYVGIPLTNFDPVAADVNGDGAVTIMDALMVTQYYVGLITSLSGCKPPPEATPVPGISSYAVHYWDCCKPMCSWPGNIPEGMEPLQTCARDGETLQSDSLLEGSCSGGPGYMCYKFIPWAVSSTHSYGYATITKADVCGKCFELTFTGESYFIDENPGVAAIGGKKMIVQAISWGFDGFGPVEIMIPGGGVGSFDACSKQWGIPNSELGALYGGIIYDCQKQYGDQDLAAIKNCIRAKNDSLFRSRGLTQMAQGLDWFIDWYEAAYYPKVIVKEVPCPTELVDRSGFRRP